MPELPEVETVCRQLRQKIRGRTILESWIYDAKLEGVNNIRRRNVVDIERRGKFIAVHLENGLSIKIHLRMTGRLFWQECPEGPKSSRWRLTFDDGYLFLVDPRRFATVKVERTEKGMKKYDLLKNFDERYFLRTHAGRRVDVKRLLMDQRAIEGIGNIYACEILHASGISPLRKTVTLSNEEWRNVFTIAKRILKTGIEKRGTSISDWRDLYGRPGQNQHELKAYGREGKPCKICGGEIHRIKQGGRSTFYCADCQK